MFICYGVERKNDVFKNEKGQEIPYDNTFIYYGKEVKGVEGMKTFFIKIKTASLIRSLGCEVKDIPLVMINQYFNLITDIDNYGVPCVSGVELVK